MSGQFDNCTSVTPACPVAATTYGYTPNLAGNVVLLAVFGICAIAQLGLGIFYRLPSYASVVTLCCVCEAVGYVGRIIMHNNPWSDVGFKIQIVCLILAPSFLAAGIYLTIKHLVRTLGPQFSRLPPHLYTWIFICFDAISIVIQAVGGGLAATGGDMTDAGGYIMLGGIAIQVATMSVCVLLAIDFAFSVWRASKRPDPSTDLGKFHTKIASRGFKFYLTATAIAFTAILVRCIYRYGSIFAAVVDTC